MSPVRVLVPSRQYSAHHPSPPHTHTPMPPVSIRYGRGHFITGAGGAALWISIRHLKMLVALPFKRKVNDPSSHSLVSLRNSLFYLRPAIYRNVCDHNLSAGRLVIRVRGSRVGVINLAALTFDNQQLFCKIRWYA